MTFTKAQQKDLETIEYFIPQVCRSVQITDEDRRKFLEYSERGLHKEEVGDWRKGVRDGFNALREGKRWRGVHIHEMWEEGVLEGSTPYFTILEGFDTIVKRKWWQFWKPTFKHNPMPRSVVDFMKKEMFKGQDAEIIEKCYQTIVSL